MISKTSLNYFLTLFIISIASLLGNSELEKCINNGEECMFINDSPPLIVDWTAKCGCTCVKMMLLESYGLLDKARIWANSFLHKPTQFDIIHGYFHEYLQQHKASLNKFFNPKYCKVKFVRNPYHRAVSSYLHAGKYFNFKSSFEEYLLSFKKQKWVNLSNLQIYGINIHTRKQSKLSDKYMHYIIKIENPDLRAVNARTGLNLSLKKCYSFHHNEYQENFNDYVGNIPFVEMNAYPPFYCYYSPRTLQLVEEIYKEDIESYGYTRPQEILDFINKSRK